jgi:hypothetical protein
MLVAGTSIRMVAIGELSGNESDCPWGQRRLRSRACRNGEADKADPAGEKDEGDGADHGHRS